jgi:hypothetical protein
LLSFRSYHLPPPQRYKSFQRQLNLWGFERKNDAVYNIKGTYSHPWFIRGRKDLTPLIARVGGAGNKFKQTNVDMNDGPSKELEKIAAEQQPVPPKNALDKKDTSMPPTEVYVPTSASKDIADHKTLSAAGFSRSAMPSSLTSMSGLYSKFMGGKTQSAVNPNMAAFLDTFQSKTPVSEAEGGTGKNLGSVISALNRAEAIGKMSAPGAPSESSSTGQDLMRRLQQQQRASSISRSRLLDEAMRITTSSDISSSANARSATPVSVANSAAGSQDDLLQHYLRRQQQRQQDSNAMIAAAMREMAQKQAVEQLLANNRAASAGGGESGPASGINSHILHRLLQQQPSSGLGGSAGGGGSGTDFLLEKLRLEESIHALMRERVRLEAAAILEERERRRLEALVNASS